MEVCNQCQRKTDFTYSFDHIEMKSDLQVGTQLLSWDQFKVDQINFSLMLKMK